VIVGVDNDVSHEPLYVYSTGEYANGPVGLLNTIKVETENFYESMQATGKHTLSITMGSTEDDADSEQNDIRVVSKANKGKARMVDSPDSTLNLRFHPTSTSTPINTKYKTTLTPRSNGASDDHLLDVYLNH
jgi:hypothetical protein